MGRDGIQHYEPATAGLQSDTVSIGTLLLWPMYVPNEKPIFDK